MNNYLNNTLTNLHLQDFLKEKGLDVSHMRYISDRQLAVDNLHMVPNMKDCIFGNDSFVVWFGEEKSGRRF